MREVAMHTAEPVSTREATERLVKILDITYAKADSDLSFVFTGTCRSGSLQNVSFLIIETR